MELRLHLDRLGRGHPDWTAAAVSGFAAGAVLMVLELMWATLMSSDGPWRVSQLIAALTLGEQVTQAPTSQFDAGVVAVALVTHYVLGIAFGLVLAFLISALDAEAKLETMLSLGAGFGIVLYLVNFHVLTAVVPWFTELRGWSTFIAHLVFGMSAALLYWRLARRGGVPSGTV